MVFFFVRKECDTSILILLREIVLNKLLDNLITFLSTNSNVKEVAKRMKAVEFFEYSVDLKFSFEWLNRERQENKSFRLSYFHKYGLEMNETVFIFSVDLGLLHLMMRKGNVEELN